MRIVSLNVGGIHAAMRHGLADWLLQQNAEVICLQDTRASCRQMEADELQLPGYFQYSCDAADPAEGGVAIYSRLQPKAVIFGLGFELADSYGRYLQADFDKVSISSLLLPDGRADAAAMNTRLRFIDDFTGYLNKQRRKRREIIYCASLQAAHQPRDLAHWPEGQHPGFTVTERAWMDEVLGNLGYVDALREVSSDSGQYSWRASAQPAAPAARFDYQLLTPGLRRFVRQAHMDDVPGDGSHRALVFDYDWTLSI